MSHIVTIQTKVHDHAAVQAACQRLGLPKATEGTARLYSGEAAGLIVQLPGWQYPVVIDTLTGTMRYDDFEGQEKGGVRWACFVSHQGAEIQLIEPSPESHLGRRLAKRGEHVHHICFTVDDPADAARRIAEQGLEVDADLNTDPLVPWQAWNWVRPESVHGTLVELARPYKAVDGRWEDGSA